MSGRRSHSAENVERISVSQCNSTETVQRMTSGLPISRDGARPCAPRQSFDIFCRVVDNYGDIGVCWRLARRLVSLPGCGPVRLWVDDLRSFARIASDVDPAAGTQVVAGVTVLLWKVEPDPEPAHEPADVVIEAFACSPPQAYVRRMSTRQLWINLEYLSAEPWVESCHGLPSLQANGLRKFFFFPGFTHGTGGLLRETGLMAQRDAWRSDPDARLALLSRLGVSPAWLQRLRQGATLAYVYCYPQAPLAALLQALADAGRDALVLLPEGIWPGELPRPIGRGDARVEAWAHPFVDQDDFDRLLWSSDLNVIRGEDSLVRAIWAGRPMIWQPYLQEDDGHLEKLAAWLALSPFGPDVQRAMQAWNRGDAGTVTTLLPGLLQGEALAAWQSRADAWCSELSARADLAENLVNFCAEMSQTR